jgi:hypothetical protein
MGDVYCVKDIVYHIVPRSHDGQTFMNQNGCVCPKIVAPKNLSVLPVHKRSYKSVFVLYCLPHACFDVLV